MDGQLSFATLDYVGKKKRTKRDVFLAEMAAAVPWSVLEAVIAPHYPKACSNGTICLIRAPRKRSTISSRCARSAIWNSDAIRSRTRRRS
jgi:hypothetical protein